MQQLEITHRVLQTVLKLVTLTTDDDFVRNKDSLTISLNFMKTRIFTVLNIEKYIGINAYTELIHGLYKMSMRNSQQHCLKKKK